MEQTNRDDGRVDRRCTKCKKLVLRAAADAIRVDRDVQIVCWNCKELLYIVGKS